MFRNSMLSKKQFIMYLFKKKKKAAPGHLSTVKK